MGAGGFTRLISLLHTTKATTPAPASKCMDAKSMDGVGGGVWGYGGGGGRIWEEEGQEVVLRVPTLIKLLRSGSGCNIRPISGQVFFS